MEDNYSHPQETTRSFIEKIRTAFHSFSRTERFAFFSFVWIFTISTAVLLWNINQLFLVSVPRVGGSLTEGVIGAPRFINPLLAVSDTDRDLTDLIYSGLLRATPADGLIHDLADHYEISEDGLVYTFTLRDNIVFHDGEPITADDVVFTITKAQDNVLKSPKRVNWEGIHVEKIDEKTVTFTLEKPYSPFLENTTIGILPKHIWDQATPEQFSLSLFNIEPIGSGPYRVNKIKRNSSGIPVYYDLKRFRRFALGSPYISTIHVKFYANEEELLTAFRKGDVESISTITPARADELSKEGYRVLRAALPRVFGVFFNQNQATIFTNKAVREALDVSLDKNQIIAEVLHGYGTTATGPIPRGSFGFQDSNSTLAEGTSEKDDVIEITDETATTTTPTNIERAQSILEADGWSRNSEDGIYEKKTENGLERLEFSLSTSDVAELRDAGTIIQKQWEELGAHVDLNIFSPSDLNQNVIRPRKYEALFFGEIIGRDSDLFAFWHSSQRNDPGLNIALYANITVDKLLEDIRSLSDTKEKDIKYEELQEEIAHDIPAIFIYTPDFIYILPNTIHGVVLGTITTASERFLDIYHWFIESNKIWKFN